MKFLKLLCCRSKSKRDGKQTTFTIFSQSEDNDKGKILVNPKIDVNLVSDIDDSRGSSQNSHGMSKWVEMKCNSLVYLKQVMKHNRNKKMKLAKIEQREQEENENEEKDEKEVKEIEFDPEMIEGQINENMSMMCPICHIFMYKAVCAT